ncbi:chaperonin 10-like protein [Mycena maculata]|uniref:Chaperonin 10-like protein n=1 Tax=Mycena maculata TaxID=230809 RepID=A0AAD7JGV0_9AGAR|nr:chaperonin 10-like protein [Mycena maculata]
MPIQTNLALIVAKPLSRTIEDRGVPIPGPEEILVRVEAAGLNPVDARVGNIDIPMWPDMPTVPGAEASGVIVAIGNEVKGFNVGDRVYISFLILRKYIRLSHISFCSAFGTAGQKVDISSYQQYSLAHSTIVTKLPPNISMEEGASIPVGLFTSYHALYSQPPYGGGLVSAMSPGGRGKYAGQPIVILGGAGATGHFALQLARLSGFSPIITTASLKHESFLKSLGATHVINRSLADTEVVKAVSALAPVLSIVFDTISTKETVTLGFEILKESKKYSKGDKTLLQIIPTSIPEAESEGVNIYMGWATSAWPQNNALSRELYSQLEGLLADGTIKPMKIEIVHGGLNALEEAFKTFDKVSGVKRVVLPQETCVV